MDINKKRGRPKKVSLFDQNQFSKVETKVKKRGRPKKNTLIPHLKPQKTSKKKKLSENHTFGTHKTFTTPLNYIETIYHIQDIEPQPLVSAQTVPPNLTKTKYKR
uniref:Uncharacterized protein n=1 Tax=Codium arenicola TaxID=1191365 RepID=A0A2P0QJ29_9CHLO|nr:hypothetical protein [Codium arenicola]ARO74388.1 hypothetical protein [Codium arenicola]